MTRELPFPSSSCETARDEYWYHVASQGEMPLAGSARLPLALSDLDSMFPTATSYRAGAVSATDVASWILANPELARQLRLVLSLSDKRFYLDLSHLFSRTRIKVGADDTICGCLPNTMRKHSTAAILGYVSRGSTARRQKAAAVIAEYLVGKGLLVVLELYLGLAQSQRAAVNDKWLAPHDVQQNETKRRGHGAEAEVAQALLDAGISLVPPNKATNPMGAPDPNISLDTFDIVARVADETISVDVVGLDQSGAPAVIAMGLVQSSDPGQFGVDKAATNGRVRRRLDEYRERTGSPLELWGIVDGIGYAENPNGTIYPMLQHFDFFVQHNSAYKAVLGAGRLGLVRTTAVQYDMNFYTARTRDQMHDRYSSGARMIASRTDAPKGSRPIRAGRAVVWVAED